jgi:iron-sulfur cluster repair protein YtfE (RIC family)
MRRLFGEMKPAVAARAAARYLGLSETLLLLMQQHNLKEENMMYPMLDQALGASAGDLLPEC